MADKWKNVSMYDNYIYLSPAVLAKLCVSFVRTVHLAFGQQRASVFFSFFVFF